MLKRLLDLPFKIPQDKLLHAMIGVILACAMARFPVPLSAVLVLAASIAVIAIKKAVGMPVSDRTENAWDVAATILGAVPVWLALWSVRG